MHDMEEYELMEKILKALPAKRVAKLLETLPLEQRMAGLPPEQRMAGLDRDHQALALPIEVLRLLPEQYLRSLSPEVQEQLQRRLRCAGD